MTDDEAQYIQDLVNNLRNCIQLQEDCSVALKKEATQIQDFITSRMIR